MDWHYYQYSNGRWLWVGTCGEFDFGIYDIIIRQSHPLGFIVRGLWNGSSNEWVEWRWLDPVLATW